MARPWPFARPAVPEAAGLVRRDLAHDLDDALPGDVLDQVQPMGAVVEQHEGRPRHAAREVPRIFVGVGQVLREILARDAPQPPVMPRRHGEPQLLDQRIAAIGVAHRRHAARALRRLDHPQRLIPRRRERLLAHRMGARLERRDRVLRVKKVGRAHMDDVRPLGAQQRRQIVIGLPAPERGRTRERPPAHRDDRAAQLLDQGRMDAGDAPAPDDGCAHHAFSKRPRAAVTPPAPRGP